MRFNLIALMALVAGLSVLSRVNAFPTARSEDPSLGTVVNFYDEVCNKAFGTASTNEKIDADEAECKPGSTFYDSRHGRPAAAPRPPPVSAGGPRGCLNKSLIVDGYMCTLTDNVIVPLRRIPGAAMGSEVVACSKDIYNLQNGSVVQRTRGGGWTKWFDDGVFMGCSLTPDTGNAFRTQNGNPGSCFAISSLFAVFEAEFDKQGFATFICNTDFRSTTPARPRR